MRITRKEQTLSDRRINRWLAAICLILSFSAMAGAQPSAPSPSAAVTAQAGVQNSNASSSVTTTTPGVALAESLTPIHGYQGVLAETVEGTVIASQSADEKFNPASAVKLATAFAALKNLGPNHRFLTSVWANGTVDAATATLNGDLVISGRDPSLRYEHAVMLARQLNDLGIKKVTGNLIVAPGFTMNFDWSSQRSGEELRASMDSLTRSAGATRAWLDERLLLGDQQSLGSVPSVTIAGEVLIGPAPPQATPLLTRRSSKLVDILKVLLCYSNNFMAERIGESLGGPDSVRALVVNSLKVNPEEVSLASTSGLGVNRVTPRAMMMILRGLRDELKKSNLKLSDILPVAGVDPGTLEDRYTDPAERGSVVAKTGTLIRTDGGASSLVGQLNTKSGRVVLFVIFNQRGNVNSFRGNQDAIVATIQGAFGGPAPFAYRPVQLSLRLATSDYEAAKARGEYEPKN
ncbi:MAG TPA: D-alanyl-D-alanine carboxypeptidase [Pyrinomonadaceae bacterium]|nr:D-alanyl-D-alanine carboxypeptidase [Pyrinomonadaceae bacterium]